MVARAHSVTALHHWHLWHDWQRRYLGLLHRWQRLHLGVSQAARLILMHADQSNSDWFRVETVDDSLQPTIDMLLNVAVFLWIGAICPWYQFAHNNVIPIYRLIPLGILLLLLRRLPIVLLLHKKIHQIEEIRQAAFVGFFGPVGVSAIFYLYVTLEFLRDVEVDGVQRADAARLAEVTNVVVWFMAICSIVSLYRASLSLDPLS